MIHGTYETFQERSEYLSKNVPELDIYELSDNLVKSLDKAGVGVNRPTFIFGYSMGGVITKILLNNSENLRNSTKGIIFYACPHFGSDVRDDTLSELGDVLTGMNRFVSHLGGIDDEEFVAFFLDNLKVSKIARFLISTDRHIEMGKINDAFKLHSFKAFSLIEGKMVYFSKTQHHYFVVKPESAYWPGSEKLVMEGNPFEIKLNIYCYFR